MQKNVNASAAWVASLFDINSTKLKVSLMGEVTSNSRV